MPFIQLIKKTLKLYASADENLWLENAISKSHDNESHLQSAFVAVPKHLKKINISLDPEIEKEFLNSVKFSPNTWSLHKFARVFTLLHFQSGNQKKYVSTLNTLFETAELNELDALYSSLTLLHYPESWLPHAKEAVRSNMGIVFEAIALNNPYPSKYFDEGAWNQMVLKTIFTGRDLQQIHGLRSRSNQSLAYMISDLAQERWAAGRPVSPQAWELVAPFIDEHLINTIEKLFQSQNESDQRAAKLCCMHSDFEPAKNLLNTYDPSFTLKKTEWSSI